MLRIVKYGVVGAVLAGTVGATAAVWPTPDKSVTLVVDGQSNKIETTASDVSGVLHGAGYDIGRHDIVAPSRSYAIHTGSTIVLRRGRLLHLAIDGVSREIWTTAPTVADALGQLGITAANFTSVSRAKRLPLKPTDITIRTPKQVTIKHDGRQQRVTTTDATAGRLLDDLGIKLGPDDRLSLPQTTALSAGTQITVTRVKRTMLSSTKPLPYPTKSVDDSALERGKTEIATHGRNGLVRITYAVVYVDGKLAGKTKIATKTLRAAVVQIEKVGTKKPVVTSPSGSPQAIAQQLLAQRGWSSQFSCLQQMWDRESGWRTSASNPSSGAYGIPQALPGSKMASAGSDWQSSARTQITWGLDYIASRYGDPCGAWATWQANGGWY
ncbi:MAG: ubiquitin-like domain-containing protein [Actinomycetota bacterium]|nr:ubiquitin-like domain-containing protein [Actinomycetota bacterium]